MALLFDVVIGNLLVLWVIDGASSHGRMIEPPSRASMGKLGYPQNNINYDDNGLNCGGFKRQWEDNLGKCGVCGDPWDGAREHEAGGKYANGIIVRHYSTGQLITVRIEVTAPHRGYFRFQICPYEYFTLPTLESCYEDLLLVTDNKTSTDRYFLPTSSKQATGFHDVTVKLPENVENSRAVIRWVWRTGNSWGEEKMKSGLGYGKQEHFYACADIAIGNVSGVKLTDTQKSKLADGSETLPKHDLSALSPTVAKVGQNIDHSLLSKCQAGELYKINPAIVDWCRMTCLLSTDYCREAINVGQCSIECADIPTNGQSANSDQNGGENDTAPHEDTRDYALEIKLPNKDTPVIANVSEKDIVGEAINLTTLSSPQSRTASSPRITTRLCKAGKKFRRENCIRNWCRKTCRRTQAKCVEAIHLGICSRQCLTAI